MVFLILFNARNQQNTLNVNLQRKHELAMSCFVITGTTNDIDIRLTCLPNRFRICLSD